MSLPPQPSPVPRVKAQTSVQLQVPSLVSQHVSCHQVTTRASPVASDNTPPSRTHTREQNQEEENTKPARMPKPMHAHTKLERHAATNDTALTNDRRNKLDNNAMPVRAPHTHIPSRPCTVPCGVPPRANEAPHCFTLACAARPTCTARPNLCAASLTCAASMQPDLTQKAIHFVLQPSTQPRTQINDMPHAFSTRGTPYAASCASAKPASLWSATRTTHPHPLTS